MTDLKTAIVNALNDSQHPGYDPVKIFSTRDEDFLIETGEYRLIDWIDGGEGRWAYDGDLVVQHGSLFDATKLSQAITDLFSKVWQVGLMDEEPITFRSKDKAEAYLAACIANDDCGLWGITEINILSDESADRLIEGLVDK